MTYFHQQFGVGNMPIRPRGVSRSNFWWGGNNRVGGGDEPPSSHTTVRTVRVYGGSIKMGNARLPSVNSLSSYASSHSTLQEVFHGIHRFLPQVRYYVFCVHHDWLNAKGYSLFIVPSFQTVLDRFVLWPLLTSDGSATPHEVGYEGYFTYPSDLPG